MGREVGGRKGKGVGERNMVWIACMLGMGREDREGEGKARGWGLLWGLSHYLAASVSSFICIQSMKKNDLYCISFNKRAPYYSQIDNIYIKFIKMLSLVNNMGLNYWETYCIITCQISSSINHDNKQLEYKVIEGASLLKTQLIKKFTDVILG